MADLSADGTSVFFEGATKSFVGVCPWTLSDGTGFVAGVAPVPTAFGVFIVDELLAGVAPVPTAFGVFIVDELPGVPVSLVLPGGVCAGVCGGVSPSSICIKMMTPIMMAATVK